MANRPEYPRLRPREAAKKVDSQSITRVLHIKQVLYEKPVILWSNIPELASLWLETLRDEEFSAHPDGSLEATGDVPLDVSKVNSTETTGA